MAGCPPPALGALTARNTVVTGALRDEGQRCQPAVGAGLRERGVGSESGSGSGKTRLLRPHTANQVSRTSPRPFDMRIIWAHDIIHHI